MKVFSFNEKLNGSYIDSVSKIAGTNTNGEFKRSEKGLAWLGNGSNAQITIPEAHYDLITGTHTFELWLRKLDYTYVMGYTSGVGENYIGFSAGLISMESDNAGDQVDWTLNDDDEKWHHYLFTVNLGVATGYQDNVVMAQAGAGFIDEIIFDRIGRNGGLYYDGYIGRVAIYDHVFSALERANAYRDFLAAKPMAIEKYPKYNPHTKPTDLSQLVDTGLVAAYNMIPNNTVLVDISGEGNNLTNVNTIQSLDGIRYRNAYSYILGSALGDLIAPVTNDFTISLRFKPYDITTVQHIIGVGDGSSRFAIGLASGTVRVSRLGGNAKSGTAYINQWHNLVVVQTGGVIYAVYLNGVLLAGTTANATHYSTDYFVIGSAASISLLPYNGEIGDYKIYNYAFTEQQAKDYHNSFAKRVKLIDHFVDAAVGQSKAREWISGTGTYIINELTAQDAVLKELDVGVKYLQCSVAGTIAIPSKQAYGTFDWYIYAASDPVIRFISDENSLTGNAYEFNTNLTGGFRLQIKPAGTVLMGETFSASSRKNIWYGIRFTRGLDGKFYFYAKGGTFGNSWVLVSVTSGANPATNNSVTVNEYFVLDFDAGDRIALINIQEGVEQ